jgi:hypothetical protein
LLPQRLDDFMTHRHRSGWPKEGRKSGFRFVDQPLLVSVVHLPAHRRDVRLQLVLVAAATGRLMVNVIGSVAVGKFRAEAL